MMEEVLVFLKPDGVIRRYIGARTVKEFLDASFEIRYFGEISPRREFIATKHYIQHKGAFFYNWLVNYVTSSHLLVFILAEDNIIREIRASLGGTIPEKADYNSIRGKYGIWGGINVAHASDNAENGKRELEIWKELLTQNKQDCTEEAKAYVFKYINFPMIDTMRYREISKQILNEEICENEARSVFIDLLLKETDFDSETVLRFAEIMVRNVSIRETEVK